MKKSTFKAIVFWLTDCIAAFFAASALAPDRQTSIISLQVLGAMHPDLSRILTLPLPDQIQVVQDLWDHISDSGQPLPVPDWQCRELDQRSAEHSRNPDLAIPWDDAIEQLRKR